eukprot:365307-Chlamydomonas_euryale.AAC.4
MGASCRRLASDTGCGWSPALPGAPLPVSASVRAAHGGTVPPRPEGGPGPHARLPVPTDSAACRGALRPASSRAGLPHAPGWAAR